MLQKNYYGGNADLSKRIYFLDNCISCFVALMIYDKRANTKMFFSAAAIFLLYMNSEYRYSLVQSDQK